MGIEIIAIGDEVLSGGVLNSNAAFLSRELISAGFKIDRHTVLPDDEERLKLAFEGALDRVDLVLVTGGLGPTCDDLTKSVLADIFKSEFRCDEEIEKDLIARFGKNLVSLKDQATVPKRASIIKNRLGTAPGFIFSRRGKTLMAMPGVPQEMKSMFLNDILPYLKRHFVKSIPAYVCRINMCLLHENDVYPAAEQIKDKYEVAMGIYPAYGVLNVHYSGQDKQRVREATKELEAKFADYIFEAPSGKLEEALQLKFIAKKKTLVLAESCTGGALAARLTALPGASQYFLGSFVTYENALKQKILKVPSDVIKQHGAVSEETVSQMALGAINLTGADFAVAVSGIAGPSGGTEQKPVGTIWGAICEKGGVPTAYKLFFQGDRDVIITYTINHLMGYLWRKIN